MNREKSNLDSLEPTFVMKKGLCDYICETSLAQDQQSYDLTPLHGLILELHHQIRALIPNRKDLHSILEDDSVGKAKSLQDLQPIMLKAAQSLAQLESESRADTTLSLIQKLESTLDDTSTNNIRFCVTVVLYLQYKTELCHADKQNFYLVNIWAPRIHNQEGLTLEKKFFQNQFGHVSDPASSPATRQWIQSLVDNQQNKNMLELLSSDEEERKNLIRAGWIEDIVFRNANQPALHLPEIFVHDAKGLQQLRDVTRLAVAGCALALHAGNAGGGSANPKTTTSPESEMDDTAAANTQSSPRMQLIQALKHRGVPPDVYETNVSHAVVRLAIGWNSSLHEPGDSTSTDSNSLLESLKYRTIAVLRGEDPVLQLLNTRIKEAVRDIVVQRMHHPKENNAFVPIESMATGVGSSVAMRQRHDQQPAASGGDSSRQNQLRPHTNVEKLLCQRGLSFFASELALMSKHAANIVELAIHIYWDDLLNKMVLDCCQQQKVEEG